MVIFADKVQTSSCIDFSFPIQPLSHDTGFFMILIPLCVSEPHDNLKERKLQLYTSIDSAWF